MGTVGSYEAKTHLSELLKRVSKGERITVTKHGVPIAELVPLVGGEKAPLEETIAAIRSFRKGRRLDGISIRDLIEEGRK